MGGKQVMQYWERPLMRQLASYATRRKGRVLEVGFGLGISADYIAEFGCEDYCVIEAHPLIAEKARAWAATQPIAVQVVEDFWQNVVGRLGVFDGILFDTYPVDADAASNNYKSFLPCAQSFLADEGVLTYYSEETREFRSDHLQRILEHFDTVEFTVVEHLRVPLNCRYWKHDHMVLPCLSRPRVRR